MDELRAWLLARPEYADLAALLPEDDPDDQRFAFNLPGQILSHMICEHGLDAETSARALRALREWELNG